MYGPTVCARNISHCRVFVREGKKKNTKSNAARIGGAKAAIVLCASPQFHKRIGAKGNQMTQKLIGRSLLFAFVLTSMMMTWSATSSAQIAISVRIGPPALPVYEQPLCPGAGYLWTPGYWAWSDDDGYYWVPGTWVEAPVGLLWTPGYWGWNDGAYLWNAGYWGSQIGFYGGINYGYGYGGNGFYGGEWRGGNFYYNTAVTRVDSVHVTNVYVNRTVIVNNESHVAFNGGQGGVSVRPTAQQETYAREPHREAIAAQVQQEHAASQNRALFARENQGRPAVAATAKPGEFSGRGVVAAKAAGGAYHAPAMSPKEARGPARPAGTEAAKGTAARPFTPPNKNNAARLAPGAKTSAPENRAENNKPASHAPSESRPATANNHAANNHVANSRAENPKPAPRASNESRPAREATPKSSPPPANEAKPRTEPRTEPHTQEAKPAPSKSRPQTQSRPSEPPAKAEPHPAPERQSAPKAAPHQSAPPKHESAPKEAEHHPGKGR